MAINVGTAWVTLAASGRGIERGIAKELKGAGTKAGQQFGEEFDKSSSKSSSSLNEFGTKAIVGAAAVGAAFFGLASASGNLSAAISANEQVLGDASTAIQDFAETGVESVGLSETAILNAATSFGQLGKQVGLTGGDLSEFSLDLVELAADMAAFKNVTPTQALEDLQSAFAGQPEVLRKYGVFLDDATLKQALFAETGERVTGTLTPQQRILATNIELFRQTADIQGQAAREADGFERQVANLKATVSNIAADFGAPIVGFASGLLETIGGGLETLSTWNTETGGMLATGLAAGIGIAAAAAGAAGVAGKIKGAIDSFGKLSKGMQLATGAVGGLALAVTAGFVIYGLMTQRSREIAARTKEVGTALEGATEDALAYSGILDGSATAADGFAVAQHALSIALTTTGEDGEALVQTLGTLGIQADDAFSTLFNVAQNGTSALGMIAMDAGFAADEANLLARASEAIGTGWPLAGAQAQGAIADLAAQFGLTTEQVTTFLGENRSFLDGLDQITDHAAAQDLEDLAVQFLNGATAASEDAEALIADAEARAEANDVADSSVDTYNELLAMLAEMPEAERDAAVEALGLADAQGTSAGATDEATSALVDNVRVMGDMEDAAADAESEVAAFSDALDRLIGVGLDAREAERGMRDAFDEIAESAKDADGNVLSFHDVIDGFTPAARDAQAAIDEGVRSIIDFGRAQIDAGASVEGASSLMLGQADVLVSEVAEAYGITEEEARNYINTLGLTPESISTAVELMDLEAQKTSLQGWVDDLGGVPEDIATQIEAVTDERSLELARQRLVAWAAAQNPTVFIAVARRNQSGLTAGAGGGQQSALAWGGYVAGGDPHLAWVGDAPWDEAMVTVGNMANLRRQLMDDRIGGPILDALPKVSAGALGGGSAPLVGGNLIVGSRDDAAPMMEALDELRWRAKVAS